MKFIGLFLLLILLFWTPEPASAEPASQDCGDTYRVVRGDWLSVIAYRCGVTVDDLLEANSHITNPARIYPGQVLEIPRKTAPTIFFNSPELSPGWEALIKLSGFPPGTLVELGIGQKDEDLVSVGKKETDSRGRLTLAVEIPTDAQPGQQWVAGAATLSSGYVTALSSPVQVVSEPPTYLIKRGDRLSAIAVRHNTSVASLLDFNPKIENPHRIYVGQKIFIPPENHQPSLDSLSRASFAPVPPSPGGSTPKDIGPGERWIDVNLTTQSVHAYEGDTLVRSFLVSTGKPSTPTVTGQYRIYIKLEKTDMRGPGYHLRDVPHTMYFHKGFGLHGTYWHNNFGTPMSAGCVNLTRSDAEWLYHFASVGTVVNVHH
jgi:lipoprotein-anchoring transpeptidase ErfK/SrfK